MKKILACITSVMLILCTSCGKSNNTDNNMIDFKRGLNDYNFTKASYASVDRLNREITPMNSLKTDHDRYVGVFYFLWLGTHKSSAGVYDVTKLQKTENGAAAVLDSSYEIGQKVEGTASVEDGYPDGMESPTNYVHWTNEPLYGYYNSADKWVIARHIELLTMADIDFIFFDTTNEFDYSENVNDNYFKDSNDEKSVQLGRPTYAVLDTILEMSKQGWDVPKVVFYTNNRSGEMVDKIYKNFYADGKYDSIWFQPFGKPMIVGTTEKNVSTDMRGDNRVDISPDMQNYFDVRESQWPNQASKDSGFPWMDWSDGANFYFADNKMMNVNVAQHGATQTSYSAYTQFKRAADGRSSRGWDKENFTIQKDWTAGKNIEDQWNSVFKYQEQGKSIEMITVTAWNEWLAWKYNNGTNIQFIDNFSNEFSRDMEMDKNYYKDNFYLQLVRNVRKYKYGEAKSNYKWQTKTITKDSDFDDVKAVYKDVSGDAIERDFYGFDIRNGSKEAGLIGSWYTDKSNRNDIVETKVVNDSEYLYLRIKTKDAITQYVDGENWMNVLIKTGDGTNWEGYNYIINRNPTGNKTSVEKSSGGWNWTSVGSADMNISGNVMTIKISLSLLGLNAKNVKFEFKVADNVTDYKNIMDYYVTGDSAPIGRLNYSYGY